MNKPCLYLERTFLGTKNSQFKGPWALHAWMSGDQMMPGETYLGLHCYDCSKAKFPSRDVMQSVNAGICEWSGVETNNSRTTYMETKAMT